MRAGTEDSTHVDSETSRCPGEFSTEKYHRRRELAKVRKAVKVPRSPSSKERGTPWDSKCLGTDEGCSALGSSSRRWKKNAKGVTELQKPTVIATILFPFARTYY